MTSVAGAVNQTAAGSLEMTVQRIDGRRIALFNFAETGASSATDANPAHYQVSHTIIGPHWPRDWNTGTDPWLCHAV